MLNITDPVEARKIIRADKYDKQTAGIAGKYVQGNLCILPSKYAIDFAAFCQKNPKPCPLIGFGTKGNPYLKDLGDIDIRTDGGLIFSGIRSDGEYTIYNNKLYMLLFF